MTQHIKCALIMLLLISVSCSGNVILEEFKQDEPVADQGNDKFENFSFFKSFQFCDNPYAAFTQEEAERIYVNKEINLDLSKGKKIVDWNSFFYEGAKQCIEDELGEKYTSSYLFSTNEDFPFDDIILFNNTYLLIAQDGYFFVFSDNNESDLMNDNDVIPSLKKVYDNCESTPLPIKYSYEFIMELNHFKKMDSPVIPELNHLSDFQFSKLPSFGNTNLLLVSGSMDSGQSELYLFTLNSSFEKVDALLLYTSHEIEEGSISTRFNISKDYRITLTKEENSHVTKLIEENLIEISQKGNFFDVN